MGIPLVLARFLSTSEGGPPLECTCQMDLYVLNQGKDKCSRPWSSVFSFVNGKSTGAGYVPPLLPGFLMPANPASLPFVPLPVLDHALFMASMKLGRQYSSGGSGGLPTPR